MVSTRLTTIPRSPRASVASGAKIEADAACRDGVAQLVQQPSDLLDLDERVLLVGRRAVGDGAVEDDRPPRRLPAAHAARLGHALGARP